MSDYSKYKIDFNFLNVGVLTTIILAILKSAKIIDISVWWVLSPLLISLGICFLIIFSIGLLIVLLISKEIDNQEDNDSEDTDDEEDTD